MYLALWFPPSDGHDLTSLYHYPASRQYNSGAPGTLVRYVIIRFKFSDD